MEVSALKYSGGGRHGRGRLLRLQSDERLVALIRRGNGTAFEVLVDRYEARLLAFCRHMLGSREDAEDVMQEVLAASYNAMLADEREINVRPWLYRIARNRCLNHLRRAQAIGVDSMDIHFSDHGASTADKVHRREEFRMLMDDIHALPETQRTALVLRELDALSYDQIAEAMETTVSSVKSLLVRARASLADASAARLLACDEVRIELAEVAEGLRKKVDPPVRRHLKSCDRCRAYDTQMKRTGRALSGLLPLGGVPLLQKLLFAQIGHSAGSGAGGAGAGAAGAAGGAGAATGASAAGGLSAGASAAGAVGAAATGGSGGLLTAGVSTLATKAAAGLAAAAIVTAGAVEAGGGDQSNHQASAAGAAATAKAVSTGAAQVKTKSGRVVAAGLGAPQHQGRAAKKHAAIATKHKGKHAGTTTTATTQTVAAAATTTPAATTPVAGISGADGAATGSGGASLSSTTPATTPTTTSPAGSTTSGSTTPGTTTTPTGTTTDTSTTSTTSGTTTTTTSTTSTTSTGPGASPSFRRVGHSRDG